MITLLVICLVGIGIFVYFSRGFIISMFSLLIKESVRQASEENEQKLKEQSKFIEKNLESKNDLILDVLKNVTAELRQNQEKAFNLSTVIDEHKKTTEKLLHETSTLSRTLSNNQLRGAFGQEMAESLLKLVGFVKPTHYISQEQQTTGNRPDITFYLPNNTKLNIDVKFPFQALKSYFDTEKTDQKEEYLNTFRKDIKARFKELKTRDYINPEDNTVDFVIMFVPNEMTFSFIYEQCQAEYEDARKNKIFICGPVSFVAVLRMIQQFSDNIRYQKNLSKIVGYVQAFEKEYEKYGVEFEKLGNKIKDACNVYNEVSGTRNSKLTSLINDIKSVKELPVPEGDVASQE
jgi:DNA recombination protein RmuC